MVSPAVLSPVDTGDCWAKGADGRSASRIATERHVERIALPPEFARGLCQRRPLPGSVASASRLAHVGTGHVPRAAAEISWR